MIEKRLANPLAPKSVIPAKAGIQEVGPPLDSGFRRNDGDGFVTKARNPFGVEKAKRETCCLFIIGLMSLGLPAHAEIRLDGSLNGQIGPLSDGPKYAIGAEFGRQSGTNLFHSFTHFSLENGETAVFSGPETISNVISRVTGGAESVIDGTLSCTIPDADFYLLNPAGVLFKENAQLDLKGSFYVSTANYLAFQDGTALHAELSRTSVFSSAPPAAFGFVTATPAPIRKERSVLRLQAGETLNFTGGDLAFDDRGLETDAESAISVQDGTLMLISVASPGEVALEEAGTVSQAPSRFGTVSIKDEVSTWDNAWRPVNIDVSGEGGGRVFIRGGEVHLEHLQVYADTRGNSDGRGVLIQADGEVRIDGSRLTAEALRGTGGDSGDIELTGRDVVLTTGTSLATTTRGKGNAGDIRIQAHEAVSIVDEAEDETPILSAKTDGKRDEPGNGGTIRIGANILNITGGTVSSQTVVSGDAGNVEFHVDTLKLSEGAVVSVNLDGSSGQGGKLSVQAETAVTIEGQAEGGRPSALSSNVNGTFSSGSGGEVYIETPHLLLENGGSIQSKSESNHANAGDITLNLSGNLAMRNAEMTTDVKGATGGNITLNSPGYMYLQDSLITACALDSEQGDGGNITLKPEFVVLDDSFILAQAAGKAGEGGKVEITAKGVYNFSDFSGARVVEFINADATGGGIDGEVEINAPEQESLEAEIVTAESPQPMPSLVCSARDDASRFLGRWYEALPPMPDDWLTTAPLLDDAALNAGRAAYRQGNYAEAVKAWRAGWEAGPQSARLAVAPALASAYQRLGMYYQAFEVLDDTLPENEQFPEDPAYAPLLIRFSDLWLALGYNDTALKLARRAVSLTRNAGHAGWSTRARHAEANALAVEALHWKNLGAAPAAVDELLQSAASAYHAVEQDSGEAAVRAVALLNRVRLPRTRVSANESEALWRLLQEVPKGEHKAFLLNAAAPYLPDATTAYQAALRSGANARSRSLAYAGLSAEYLREKYYSEAMAAILNALSHANAAPDLSYRHWSRAAEIAGAQGDDAKARKFYRHALSTVQHVQSVMDGGYRDPRRSFSERLRPIYRKPLKLLLARARNSDGAARQTHLRQALALLEQFHKVEMSDYFRDECLLEDGQEAADKTGLPADTAILYPIVLPDGLELLLEVGDKLFQARADVDAETLEKTARNFRKSLETRIDDIKHGPLHYRVYAERFYHWLIAPLEAMLRKTGVNTLVTMPDGPLRGIPLAALYDGEQFLFQRYTLAVMPTRRTHHATATDWRKAPALVAGVSKVKGFAPLPKVADELRDVQALSAADSDVLAEFSFAEFEAALRADKHYSVVHLATHGKFSSDPQFTYLLAKDRRIGMADLQTLIALQKRRGHTLELLTLSACDTAAGDERAALGLAGTVVKAGARSALAGLWRLDDAASAELMRVFYRELLHHGRSRGEALQQAQLALFDNPRYRHPMYWAPFLLLGDWR